MSLSLGIDTGGTYTDAVLFDRGRGVLASAKALTTKHDLAVGIGEAIERVLSQRSGEVDLVSVSTTLATNALVEGQGSRAGLLLIGFDEKSLGRAALGEALAGDPVAFLEGGNSAFGVPQRPLDMDQVADAVRAQAAEVSAFALAGHFAVRNPAQELAVRDFVRRETGLPVTCSHELSSNLDAPRRALTTLLNARLIALLQDLITSVQDLMSQQGIDAPLMVVKGDGSLISAATALGRPIETILSGPAASVIGARFLSGETDAVISDIGGTTTDIAILRGGNPVVSPDGATVGGWRTMVEAISVHTVGLGGDSEVRLEREQGLRLGPRRVVPLSLLGSRYPAIAGTLKAQLADDRSDPGLGRFALRNRRSYAGTGSLKKAETEIWEALEAGPLPLTELGLDYLSRKSLENLLGRGLVAIAGFTPSDAAHVLSLQDQWDAAPAHDGAALLLRRARAEGLALPRAALRDPAGLCGLVVEQVVRQTGRAVVGAILAEEGAPAARPEDHLGHYLLEQGLAAPKSDVEGPPESLLEVSLGLQQPLVGAGAPAAVYYPAVARQLRTRLALPAHSEVANAVGAAASGVVQRVTCLITAPEEGRYRVHVAAAIQDFPSLESAARHAEQESRRLAHERAARAGAGDIQVRSERSDTIVEGPGGQTTFIESTVIAHAVGQPRLATA